jgi:heme/copper-type cytochrome/quinol oxidase subunit 2
MFILLLISFLCFWILWRFTRSVEIREYGNWRPFSSPLWIWAIAGIVCLIPIINVIGVIFVISITIADSRSSRGDTRFTEKNGINNFITKILNFLNKEY